MGCRCAYCGPATVKESEMQLGVMFDRWQLFCDTDGNAE